jgi:hypothetical protein
VGLPNSTRNTYGHYAAPKFAANTGAQTLHVLCRAGVVFSGECSMLSFAILIYSISLPSTNHNKLHLPSHSFCQPFSVLRCPSVPLVLTVTESSNLRSRWMNLTSRSYGQLALFDITPTSLLFLFDIAPLSFGSANQHLTQTPTLLQTPPATCSLTSCNTHARQSPFWQEHAHQPPHTHRSIFIQH